MGYLLLRQEAHAYFFPGRLKAQLYIVNTTGTDHLRQYITDVCVCAGIDGNAAFRVLLSLLFCIL